MPWAGCACRSPSATRSSFACSASATSAPPSSRPRPRPRRRPSDPDPLPPVSGQPEPIVHDALEVAISQQLLEEDLSRPGRYSWRHALTQEAIYAETVTPRRQRIHSRAADVLAGAETTRP